jgi:hypothetical protein
LKSSRITVDFAFFKEVLILFFTFIFVFCDCVLQMWRLDQVMRPDFIMSLLNSTDHACFTSKERKRAFVCERYFLSFNTFVLNRVYSIHYIKLFTYLCFFCLIAGSHRRFLIKQ